MREKSPQSMLKWISRTYEMSPAALARMFQRNARTVNVWLKDGRISPENGGKIRSAFYYLNNSPDPHDPSRSGIDMVEATFVQRECAFSAENKYAFSVVDAPRGTRPGTSSP